MSNKQLPSWIKPNTPDAYNHAYTMLYCGQPKDIRESLDEAKKDNNFSNRETREFIKEVIRMAQYEHSFEDLKALERREKIEGVHPSQQKKQTEVKVEDTKIIEKTNLEISPSGDNPS